MLFSEYPKYKTLSFVNNNLIIPNFANIFHKGIILIIGVKFVIAERIINENNEEKEEQ
jgi:hypothetical protein